MKELLARFLSFLAKRIAPPPTSLLPGPNEIVPGTPKPSVILADMVKLAIQQNPELVKKKYLVDKDMEKSRVHTTSWSSTYRYTWQKGDKIKVLMDHKHSSRYGGYSHDYHYTQLFINGNLQSLTTEEAKVIVDALFAADDYVTKQEQINKEAERQRLAVDAIESFVIGNNTGD